MKRTKLIRITTVPISLASLLQDQLKYMKNQGFDVIGVSSPGDELDQVRKTQGIQTVAIPMTRTISPLKDLKSLWLLYKLFKKEKPDIVHSHTPKAGTLGMIAAKLAGTKIRLHTVAGLPLLEAAGPKRKLLDSVEKITYSAATHVYPNSYGLEKIILKNNFTKEEKLKVIAHGSSNGIDTSAFDPASVDEATKEDLLKELRIDKDDFIFLFVGRVVSDKGINELVQAFRLLTDNPQPITDDSQPQLIIVGSYESDLDPLLPKTEKLIQEHPYIHTVGFRSNVKDYFAIADVLTFPSYREGFPNVVMQAAAMQLNAIVTDINGCNEIITNGDNGWIIPPKNVDQLKERMQWCMENPEESKKMGLKGRKLMIEKYERSFVWEELLGEYRRLLMGEE